ncbi:MAG: hypothetical protein WA954_00855 [Parerythrobacter sp.]
MTEPFLALVVLLVGAALLTFNLKQAYSNWYGIILLGVIVRLVLAVADRYYIDLPQSSSDARVFLNVALAYSRTGCGDFSNFDTSASYVYSAVIGQAFACVGKSELAVQFANCFANIVGCIALAKTTEMVWNKTVAYRVLIFLVLFPTLILYSAVTLRESFIFMLFSLGMYYFLRAFKTKSFFYLTLSVFSLFAASAFHGGMLFAVFGLLGGMLFSGQSVRYRWIVVTRMTRVAVVLLLFVGLYAYIGTLELNKFGSLAEVDTETVASIVESRAQGGSAYLEGLPIGSPIDLLWQAPVRIFYFMFSPLPWDISTPAHLFGLLDVIFWFYLTYNCVRFRRVIFQNRMAVILLSVLVVLSLAFAFGTSNFGTAMRHRTKFVPILFVIAGPALVARRRRDGQHQSDQSLFYHAHLEGKA